MQSLGASGANAARMREEETLGQSRIAAFSDGVFAVAITLLVLDLQVPKGSRESLPELLHAELGSYAVFVLSFVIIGIKWLNHHRMLSLIRRADTTLMLLNLVLLLGVTVVPFTTSLLAHYLPSPDAPLAAMLYGLVWLLNGIAYTLVLWYAQRRGFTTIDPRAVSQRRMLFLYLLGPIGYAVGVALSLVNVPAAIVLYLVVVSAYVLPPPRARRAKDGART
jgi:uncharacterized membrane protein